MLSSTLKTSFSYGKDFFQIRYDMKFILKEFDFVQEKEYQNWLTKKSSKISKFENLAFMIAGVCLSPPTRVGDSSQAQRHVRMFT